MVISATVLVPSFLLASFAPIQQGFTFAGQTFVPQFKKDNLHEFTPKGQSDLNKFIDMVTINEYRSVRDGSGLAMAANSVLQAYKNNGAVVVRTDSVPKSKAKPAEHLIVVIFPRPEFMEASFARFLMNKGVGTSLVYSHRIYGKNSGDQMSAWLLKNGEKREKELMGMASVPKY